MEYSMLEWIYIYIFMNKYVYIYEYIYTYLLFSRIKLLRILNSYLNFILFY